MADVRRNRQLVRVLGVIASLQYWTNVHRLSGKYRVTTRTIRRDLDAIEQAGIMLMRRHGFGDRDETTWIKRTN